MPSMYASNAIPVSTIITATIYYRMDQYLETIYIYNR